MHLLHIFDFAHLKGHFVLHPRCQRLLGPKRKRVGRLPNRSSHNTWIKFKQIHAGLLARLNVHPQILNQLHDHLIISRNNTYSGHK
jgi:hypothetical protein